MEESFLMEEKQNKKNIGVIGGGSWATAIVKMLCENVNSINWWMRNEDSISHIETYGHNPNYISDAELKKEMLLKKHMRYKKMTLDYYHIKC